MVVQSCKLTVVKLIPFYVTPFFQASNLKSITHIFSIFCRFQRTKRCLSGASKIGSEFIKAARDGSEGGYKIILPTSHFDAGQIKLRDYKSTSINNVKDDEEKLFEVHGRVEQLQLNHNLPGWCTKVNH